MITLQGLLSRLFSEEMFGMTNVELILLNHTRILFQKHKWDQWFVYLRRQSCKQFMYQNIPAIVLAMHGEVAQGPSELLHSLVL